MSEKKTFVELNINDTFYEIMGANIVPAMKKRLVDEIKKEGSKHVKIHADGRYTTVPNTLYQHNSVFTAKEDCLRAFEELCSERVVAISKALEEGKSL